MEHRREKVQHTSSESLRKRRGEIQREAIGKGIVDSTFLGL